MNILIHFIFLLRSQTFLNLSSGMTIPSEITKDILALPLKEKTLAKYFIKKRIITNKILFNNLIKKNIYKNTFERKSSPKVMICRGGKEKDLCHTPSHLHQPVLLIPMEQ